MSRTFGLEAVWAGRMSRVWARRALELLPTGPKRGAGRRGIPGPLAPGGGGAPEAGWVWPKGAPRPPSRRLHIIGICTGHGGRRAVRRVADAGRLGRGVRRRRPQVRARPLCSRAGLRRRGQRFGVGRAVPRPIRQGLRGGRDGARLFTQQLRTGGQHRGVHSSCAHPPYLPPFSPPPPPCLPVFRPFAPSLPVSLATKSHRPVVAATRLCKLYNTKVANFRSVTANTPSTARKSLEIDVQNRRTAHKMRTLTPFRVGQL